MYSIGRQQPLIIIIILSCSDCSAFAPAAADLMFKPSEEVPAFLVICSKKMHPSLIFGVNWEVQALVRDGQLVLEQSSSHTNASVLLEPIQRAQPDLIGVIRPLCEPRRSWLG